MAVLVEHCWGRTLQAATGWGQRSWKPRCKKFSLSLALLPTLVRRFFRLPCAWNVGGACSGGFLAKVLQQPQHEQALVNSSFEFTGGRKKEELKNHCFYTCSLRFKLELQKVRLELPKPDPEAL